MKGTIRILIISFFMNVAAYAKINNRQFEIKFFNDRGSIGIICSNGCNWSNMSIKKNKFHLNQFGMVHYGKNSDAQQNSTYLFSIEKKNKKVYLKSIKGTQWKELSFDLPTDSTRAITITNLGIVE